MKIHVKNKKYNFSCFILSILIIVLYNSGYSQQPTLTWLGTLGGNKSEAQGVSDDGSVVIGVSNKSNGDYHAFMWTATTGIQDMGTLGGDGSEATGISSDGSVIVGWAYDVNAIYRAFKWTAANGIQDIGAGDWSKASGVSADGLVIAVNSNSMAYRWTSAGGLENIGNLGGNSTGVTKLSADGSVMVGLSKIANGDPYAFRWIEGTGMQNIGTFYSWANGVSRDGNTVVGAETGSAGLYRAFKWTQSGGFELNIAGNFSQGNAANENGSLVFGDYPNGAFRLSSAGGLESLNQVYSELLTAGSELYSVWDISTDGKILVGSGRNGMTNQDEGFLLDLSGTTSVNESQVIPETFRLSQNYPNPFNADTKISYGLSQSDFISLKVYDLFGKEIKILVNETKPAGVYDVDFNASNIKTGIYLYKFQTGKNVETKKMILLR